MSKYFGTAVVVLFVLAAAARAAPVHCPEQFNVEQRAVDVPTSLQAFDAESRHHWVNAQFSDGSPVQQAWLAPESSRKGAKSFIAVWRFTPSNAGIWLACGYTGTSMVAAFRLPDGTRSCEVDYDANFSPPPPPRSTAADRS